MGDGAAGAGGDVGEVFAGAGDGAGGEVQAEAEILEQAELPADQVRQQGDAGAGMGDQMQHAAENAGVGLALRNCALGDGTGGGEDGERPGIVHSQGGAGVDELGGDGAELVGEAGGPAGLNEVAGLPKRGFGAGEAATGKAADGAVVFGEEGDDGVVLAIGAGGEDDAGGVDFHGAQGRKGRQGSQGLLF